VDVSVTLHDSKQPLCIDGIVASGQWAPAPPRPLSAPIKEVAKGDVSPSKEENAEQQAVEAALSQSLASFKMPQDREIKMDLRWRLEYVTSTIARTFGLRREAAESLWLFHSSPSSSHQDPLNTHTMRSEQTLKDLQRNSVYNPHPQKKTFSLHAVELTYPPGGVGNPLDARPPLVNLCPFCVRFYDDAVREVGSVIISVPNSSRVEDVLAEAKQHILPEWNINGPLRLLEVSDSRMHKLHDDSSASVSSFACFNKSNIFYHCLRVEADDIGTQSDPNAKVLEIFHCDRQSQQAFAQPLLISAVPGEKAGALKKRCQAKLQVPESEFRSWRLVRCRSRKVHLKDDEAWDSDNASGENNLCLEHVHPNPTSVRFPRHNKPLTIK